MSPEKSALEDGHVRHVVAGTELQLTCIPQWGIGMWSSLPWVAPVVPVGQQSHVLCSSVINRPGGTFFN